MKVKTIMFITAVIIALVALLGVAAWLTLSSADRSVLFSEPRTITHDGRERTYRLYQPARITPETKLVVALDGFSGNGRRFAYITGLHNVDTNTVVVYPDPLPKKDQYKTGWNAGFCCGSGLVENADDSGFIATLTNEVRTSLGIASDRVFVAGFSNGGFMAQKLAIDHPQMFRGVAVVASAIGTTNDRLRPTAAQHILMIHGRSDDVIPFEGGSSGDPDFVWLSFSEMEESWRSINDGTHRVESQEGNDGHKWFGWRILDTWNKTPQASRDVIEFFDSL